ncbi:carbohydrate porin [Desulfosoma caldarium]|uniref:Carbohydrate-selective porin (OprB family) n=1 Tax=Desulfosoma caldarium TaxID=610254 RepID=A0A3N1UY53_9BACT|nr:carbohydrate porin [Desulfosoma caldarium]ROQ92196.1 carbohydrate-selective porin (OprB family) [Desulfosoma caldarium]
MKKCVVLCAAFFVLAFAGLGRADDAELKRELQMLKQRVQELEAKLKAQEAIQRSTAAAPGDTQMGGEEPTSIQDMIMEKFGTLSIHGGVLTYYQGRNGPNIDDMDYSGTSGAGYVADLELSFEPTPNGEFFMRIHAGEGQGADKDLDDEGALFANLNTIADDNPENEGVSVLEAFYTHKFFEERLFVSVGKSEQVAFIDDNEFANDEATQFVGKPFVVSPMLDSEDEYAPMLAVGFSPVDNLEMVVLYESTSRPLLSDEDQKSVWDDIFDNPFVAAQMTFSPEFNGLQGNYRVYGWGATYKHPKIVGEGTDRGWGIGLSLDQMVHDKVGLFARLAYSNDNVYEVPWFWSFGANLKGMIPNRDDDEIGLGVAGLKANDDLDNDGTEYHLEAYYRIVLSEHLAISPDIQFVINPLGDTNNDNVVAFMIRGEFNF